MNLIDGVVANGAAMLGGGIRLPLIAHLSGLSEGRYMFGLRANHLSITQGSIDDVAVAATTELAEVNGSETFIHVGHHGTSWVVQEEGVYPLGLGRPIQVFVNPRHVFAFDGDGMLVAAPRRRAHGLNG